MLHETAYTYAAPVSVAQHLAHLRPLGDTHQRLLQFDLAVDPPPPRLHERRDTFGNACNAQLFPGDAYASEPQWERARSSCAKVLEDVLNHFLTINPSLAQVCMKMRRPREALGADTGAPFYCYGR